MKSATLNKWMLVLFVFAAMGLQQCTKTDQPAGNEAAALSKSGKQVKAMDLELVAGNLVSPIGLVPFPDASGRLAVIDQAGMIRIIDGEGNLLAEPFIDITSIMVPLSPGYDERGLLGLAFHPAYASNGRFYLYYNAPPNPGGPTPTTSWNNESRISEFRVSADPNKAMLQSERNLIRLDDPQMNHNGGTITFGRDGYLYIAIGDGGGANDVGAGHVEDWYPVNAGGNAQNIEANLFGKILRIDVNGNPYSIPADNPFVGKPGRDEIWAYGFRNPFRISFDMGGSRELYAGDAGQLLYEEIDVVKKGGNYGWNVKEGFHCFSTATPDQALASCPDTDAWGNRLTDPVLELNNWRNPAGGPVATTIIGGNIYRGHSIPGLQGKYIFGTFSQSPTTADGELFLAQPAGSGPWNYNEIALESYPNDLGMYLKGFGQDLKGEIYLTTSMLLGPTGNTGKVFRLVAAE